MKPDGFIPCRRQALIELCMSDGKLEDPAAFSTFCTLLIAHQRHAAHARLERLKEDYALFHPDEERQSRPQVRTEEQTQARLMRVIEDFEALCEKANQEPLTSEQLKRALAKKTLIELETRVDMEDFAHVRCFVQGHDTKEVSFKKWGLFESTRTIEIYERLALLIQFKQTAEFEAMDEEAQAFSPGKMYVHLYKNIPKNDLELVFPNVEISMTLRDRLLFGVPALIAGVPVLIKALPKLKILIGLLLFIVFGPAAAARLGVEESAIRDVSPVLTAVLAVLVTFGGFAFKQYSNYVSKKVKFQKDVTDTLFFRSLVTGEGVFHVMSDAAEEEQTKEMILTYYILLQEGGSLSREALDGRIEAWLQEKLQRKVDFDIDKALVSLSAFQDSQGALLQSDSLSVLGLDEACALLNRRWDAVFLG